MVQGMIIREFREFEIPDFGERLRAARIADGRSPQQLATLAGITVGYWYKLEAEAPKWVSGEVLSKIEGVLGRFWEGDRHDD